MSSPEVQELHIRGQFDCAAAQRAVREMTAALRFDQRSSEEVVLAVAELAANLVKHAGQGVLTLKPVQASGQIGIEVHALDHGPGIKNIEQSFADGYSTVGTLGFGLGAVNRLMDEMDVDSAPDWGTHIVCRRWLRPREETLIPRLWEAEAATRSHRMAPANGDAFVIKEWQGKLLAGVIDGLGHGEPAQQAALAAQHYVQQHYDQPLDRIFSGASRTCRGTRGVVMALARLESPGRITFASLGNIEARVWSGSEKVQFDVRRGIVGFNDYRVTVQEHRWSPGWVLVLHSDGLRSGWQWRDFPGLEREPAAIIASRLLRDVGDRDDDATVLAVRDSLR